ncbi:MAG: hypothetical protein LBQ59_03180, partial [Candidatus Peribacteria bacterium]|nr:hypothetical protein [Candidatus Peribacteria bacterium]
MNEKLQYDADLQTFLKDQEIEDAYQVLKPVLDKIHEEFITKSLESDEAKKIDFSSYLNLKSELVKLKNTKSSSDQNKKKQIEKRISEDRKS